MNQKCVRFYGQWRSQDVFIGVAREGKATSLVWHGNLHCFNIKMWLTIKY